MKSTIYLLFGGLLFLGYSCDLFEDDPANNDDCKLINSSFNIPNDPAHGETSYTYNTDGKLTSIESSDWDRDPLPYKSRIQINYSGDLVSDIHTFSTFMSDPEERQFEYTFFYEAGVLDSVRFDGFNAFVNSDGYYLVEYSNDQLMKVERFNYDNFMGVHNHYSTSVLNWDADNVSSVDVIVHSSSDTIRRVFSYDSMKPLIDFSGLVFLENSYYRLSANNIIKEEYYLNNTLSRTDNYSYSYTPEGYPMTSQQIPNYPLYNYSYNCN